MPTMTTEQGLRKNPLPEQPHWLKVGAQGSIGVDRENRAVLGYVVAQQGPFREPTPRGEFDEKSLRQIVSIMRLNKNGTKVRLGHGTMSDDGVSRFMGRAKNPRLDSVTVSRDGKEAQLLAVRADLYLAEAAFETNPNGNLGEWLLTLADEDPGAIGSSLVLQAQEEWRLDTHKQRKRDDDGNELPPLWRVTKIHSSDIVSDGAAVDELLSAEGMDSNLLLQGVSLLDAQFAGQTREVVRARLSAFMERYLTHRFGEDEGHSDLVLAMEKLAFAIDSADADTRKTESALHAIGEMFDDVAIALGIELRRSQNRAEVYRQAVEDGMVSKQEVLELEQFDELTAEDLERHLKAKLRGVA